MTQQEAKCKTQATAVSRFAAASQFALVRTSNERLLTGSVKDIFLQPNPFKAPSPALSFARAKEGEGVWG
jgi:hypothetical protein